jgi:ATP adenylyltransferase
MASSFKHLRDFIQKQMRMSHIYQPVMIRELLKRGGKASIHNIAAAFLARDASQLEYYEQITKNMPGKVLAKHGIVERDRDQYRLAIDRSSLSSQERDELVRLCDEAISTYLEKRGTAVYNHRRAALGYLSGSLRYEVLKRAGFRCELCGISAKNPPRRRKKATRASVAMLNFKKAWFPAPPSNLSQIIPWC